MEDETQKPPPEQDNPETNGEDPLAKLVPICPHCGADPVMPIGIPFNMPPAQILIVFCRKCRNAIPAILLGVEKPRVQIPGAAPKIFRPQ